MKVHGAIVDWYLSNGEDGIKWKFLYMPKYKRAEEIKKNMESCIRDAVDGPEFNGDRNLAGFDSWVKNKAQNGVFNLKQLLENMFPAPEAGEVVTPGLKKCGRCFCGGIPWPKGCPRRHPKLFLGGRRSWRSG